MSFPVWLSLTDQFALSSSHAQERSSSSLHFSLSAGDCLGGLRQDGPQMLHGGGSDLVGGTRSFQHGHRLVQAVPTVITG